MSKLYTVKDLESMLQDGKCLGEIPPDARFTPMALDLLRQEKQSPNQSPSPQSPSSSPNQPVSIHSPVLPSAEYNWVAGKDPKTSRELEKFFFSPAIQQLKERMVKIGNRIYGRGYVDGNGGNITIRVGDNLVLCTPTLISKGFMTVDDLCMVDLEGVQVAGTRPSTSEVKTHLGIMKREPQAKSCVHAHPIYSTAFAVANVVPPSCLIPESEVFLGEIGLAPYETPGTPEVAASVGEMAKKHQSILMANHGLICWGKDVEDAFWKMENTEAICQTFVIAQQLGSGPKQYGPDKLKDLIKIRKSLGMPDHRMEEFKECELCDTSDVALTTQPQPRACECQNSSTPPATAGNDPTEDLVKQITDMVMTKLNS
jgi:L-fuculose-phosphate aldolase